MATHRRGLRPSQWPVRDLLGPADRGRLWDARIGAAVAGLLACSAAVTVVLTSGDTATSDASPETPQPGPLALPPPAAVDPAPVVPPALKLPPPPAALPAPAVLPAPAMRPAPAGVVPAPAAPPRLAPSRPQRSVDRPASRLRRPPAVAAAPVPGPTLAEQIAAGIEQWEDRSPDRPTAGWLLIPVQRPADAAALLELACRNCEQETGGRHRAPDRDDVEQSPDRYREGGRHRAPDPEDDRSERYRSSYDQDDQDDLDERVDQDGDRAEERGDDSHGDDSHGDHEHSTPDRVEDGDQAPEDEAPEDEASADDAVRPHAADRGSSDEDEHDTQERLESDADRSADD